MNFQKQKGGVKMDNKIIVAILIIGVILVGGYLISGTGAVVSAHGQSSLEVIPDEVSVNLYIETKAESAQEAQDANAEIEDAVVIALLRTGLERKDIQLQGYSVYPDYSWEDNSRKENGFVARQQIVVETTDFDFVSEIVDAAVDNGALVSYINFELSDAKQSEYKKQALELASADAKEKAKSTAAGLGKKLGRLVSVESSDFNYGVGRVYAMEDSESGGAKMAVADLDPQDVNVQASVSVQYRLRAF